MSTSTHPATGGGLVQISSLEELVRQRVAEERARLEKEAGIEHKEIHHFHKPIERPFTAAARPHHHSVRRTHLEARTAGARRARKPGLQVRSRAGAERRLSSSARSTATTASATRPTSRSGNLVQFVQDLEAKGLTKDEICDRYVFFTAGACGPCRFGMYEAEYRLALRNAGFDKFRVLLFQQSGGLNQAEAEAGLEMNVDFFLAILNALNIGDIINDVAYQIRPYEVNAGETDRVLEESMEMLHDVMRPQPALAAAQASSAKLAQEDALRRHRGISRQVPEPALRRRHHGGACARCASASPRFRSIAPASSPSSRSPASSGRRPPRATATSTCSASSKRKARRSSSSPSAPGSAT